MQLLHDDVVLEVRVPSEVEADPVAQFIVLEGLDLKISHVTKSIFIILVNVS